MVHLANNISLVNWDVMPIGGHLFWQTGQYYIVHNTCDYKQCWCTLSLVIEAKFTKPPNYNPPNILHIQNKI